MPMGKYNRPILICRNSTIRPRAIVCCKSMDIAWMAHDVHALILGRAQTGISAFGG